MEESISLEEAISENIVNYLHRGDLINRDVASLDRIISKYFKQNDKNRSDEKKVVEFLFQCLDEKGNDASILFTHVNNSSYRNYIIRRLYSEYKETFDFNLVNSSLFLSSFKIEKTKFQLLIIIIILAISLFFVSSLFYYYKKHSNKQIIDKNGRIKEYLNDQKKYEIEKKSFNEKNKENLQLIENLNSTIEKLTKNLNEKESKIKKEIENDELEFHLKKCVDINQYYNLSNALFKFIAKSITKNLSIHGQKFTQYLNNSVLTISNTNKFDNADIRVEIVVNDLIQMYFQQSFDYCDSLIKDSIENQINNKNVSELIQLSTKDFIKPIEDNICELFINKLNEFFGNVSIVFPQKLERYSIDLRSKIRESLTKAYKNRYNKIVMLNNKDSYNAEKVQKFIKLIRLPNQKQITTFAFGRNRTFDLDENGNVIIPIQYNCTKKYKYKENGETLRRDPDKQLPINVTFNFAKMAIYTNITYLNSSVNEKKSYYFLFFGKNIETHIHKMILNIEIGGDFIFKDSMRQTYTLKNPNGTKVPNMIPITMRQ